MQETLSIAKALADRNRLRTILLLQGRELCVCQIVEMLGLAPSTVSKHLSVLHGAGLVEVRKQGRWVYYRLTESNGTPLARRALRWVVGSLGDDPQVREDQRRLKRVLATPVEVLCRVYKG